MSNSSTGAIPASAVLEVQAAGTAHVVVLEPTEIVIESKPPTPFLEIT